MKYLVTGMADDATLSAVLRAFGGSVTLAPAPGVQADAPQPAAAELTQAMHPTARKKTATKRVSETIGEWPAKGSIYDIVLQSIQTEPKSPSELREVLTAAGRSGQSLNSALGRLETANKAKRADGGGWIAA